MAYAPTINVSTDAAPAPRAEVVFSSLHPDTASLRAITRTGDGREWKVRGSVGIGVSDQVARIDYEVPFGIDVTYRAEMLNISGESLGFTDQSAPANVAVTDTWVHNPLNPQIALRVKMLQATSHQWSRPVGGETVFPIGRRVGVVIGGTRQGLRGQHFELWVESQADADVFAAMVGTYSRTAVPVLCFRIGSGVRMRIPKPLFGSVFDPREVDISLSSGGSDVGFSFDTDEVAPPAPALVIPLLTRADINAYYSTRAQVEADNASRFEVNRRYDLAGTA